MYEASYLLVTLKGRNGMNHVLSGLVYNSIFSISFTVKYNFP